MLFDAATALRYDPNRPPAAPAARRVHDPRRAFRAGDPDQPREDDGKWTDGDGDGKVNEDAE